MNKLTFCNRNEAIARMNRLGKERTRFFFLINFDETECLVSKLDDIPAGQLAFIFPEIANVCSLPDAKEVLLRDEKEAAEHATITDLIRNDLSRVASEVTVTRYRYLDELHTHCGRLLQMSSEIRGRLPENYHEKLGSLFFELLPAGSITGAPKKKTVEIIREAETYDRGFYTGVMGYFDGKNLDSAVMIRFLEHTDGGFVYKSGGGITFRSTARSEYEEMIQKIYVPIY